MVMADKATKCTACGGTLERGFMLDHTHGGYVAAEWVEGAPEWSFWRGTKVSGKRRMKVEAMRCSSCGRVELYAREQVHG
jgi:ribosomal protein L37E